MQKRRNVKTKIVASLITFMMFFSNFATLGSALVAYAADDSADAISYSVKFVELQDETQAEQVTESEPTEAIDEQNEETEEATEEEQTTVRTETVEEGTIESEEVTSQAVGMQLGEMTTEEKTEENEEIPSVEIEEEEEEPQPVETEIPEEPVTTEPTIEVPVSTPIVSKGYAIEIKVGVKESGYLKNAKVEIKDLANQLFTINNNVELGEYISSIDDNKIKLNQINGGIEVVLLVPITLKNEETVDIGRLQSGTTINFTGTYVTKEGNEEIITKSETTKMFIDNTANLGVESEFEKLIPYINEDVRYALAQIKVKAGSTNTVNMPVMDNMVEVEIPVIDGAEISNVSVAAISTAYTNGLANGDVQFTLENWKYENGIVTIGVNNNQVDGRYRVANGDDEYIITYTYVNYPEESPGIISGRTYAKSNVFNSDGTKELEYETSNEYDLSQANSNIITYEVAGNTQSFTKGYLYGNLNTEEPQYSIEFNNNLNVNISRVELLKIVEIREANEYFEDVNGNRFATTTNDGVNSYYKSVKLNKANVNSILGENGTLELLNENLDQLIEINKDTPDDGDGFITVGFGESTIDKVLFRINNPEGDGVLSITATKKIVKTTYSEVDLMNFVSLNSEFVAAAALDGDIITDMGSTNVRINLEDTITDASITTSRKELSTLVTNDDIEIAIHLNNSNELSDMYTNPVFEVILPKEVQDVDITDMNLLYGNGEFSIGNVEYFTNDEGSIVIKVPLVGTQTQYAFGESNYGTTIILNTNMKVNMYQASVDSKIELKYYNEDATNYSFDEDWNMSSNITANTIIPKNGVASSDLYIRAPEGMVNAQRISGYNGDRTIISVNQGFKEDALETYTEMKNAEMRLISINNTGEDLTDVRILGRTIFAGNTSIVGKFALGTTQNAPMTSEITADSVNQYTGTIYYSENGEATDSLEDSNNGWTTTPEDLRKVKSYLIKLDGEIPNGAILGYKYNFEIPEQLANEVDMAGTFATYYLGEKTSGLEEADKIMLSTGDAPVLDVTTVSDVDYDAAVEGQSIKFTVKVANKGNNVAKHVKVNSVIPQGTTYIENGELRPEVTELTFDISEIKPGYTEERSYEVKVNSSVPAQTYIEPASNVEADGMQEAIYTTIEKKLPVQIPKARIEITSVEANRVKKPGDKVTYTIIVNNDTDSKLHNVKVVQNIPDNVKVLEAYTENFDSSGTVVVRGDEGIVDYNNHTITFNTPEVSYFQDYRIELELQDFDGHEKDIITSAVLTASEFDNEYKSNEIKILEGKADISVRTYTSTDNKFIKEGEQIRYILSLENKSDFEASNINIKNIIPPEYTVTKFEANVGDYTVAGLPNNRLNMSLTIPAKKTAEIIANCTVRNLDNNVNEKITANNWVVTGNNINDFQTSQNQNIVVQNENVANNPEFANYTIIKEDEMPLIVNSEENLVTLNEKEEKVEVKTQKIIGKAFNDFNKNGQRDEDEEGMANVVVKLCDAKTQKVITQTTTNKAGEYIFDNVTEGEYYIKFEYESDKYAVTAYKKDGVTSDKNSDAVVSNYKAVTDKITVKDNGISDIDIGLYQAGIFDLDLDVNINQVTVQNPDETKVLEMENPKLAKYDVKPQYTNNTRLIIEYSIDVANKGELAGYAKQIVGYLPEGLVLDVSLNDHWYVGSDGNAYYNDLGDVEIKPGETKTIKLVLTKQMTEDGTGIYNSMFEISKDYNEYAIEDVDSTPGNKAQAEDDMSRADIIIGVQTGGSVVNVMIITTTLITLLVALYAIKTFVDKKNKEVIV